MPKPLFELAPKWGEQPRKTPPSPAKSDLRKVTKGFRLKEMGPLPADLYRRPLREGWVWPQALSLSRGFASRCPDPRPRQVPGAASTSRGQREQQLQPTGDLPPLQTTPTHPNSKKAASTADLPMEPSRSGRSTVGYFPADARSSTSHSSGFLIRSAERSPISPLEPIPEVQSVMRSQFKKLNWADEQKKPVSSATTAKSPLSASPEAPPTATNIASPIFGNMNPLPALRRAMSDLIPQRPAYPYDPLFDNYAPEQPFHIQWRRGGVDGQQSPVTTHLASPPIRSQRSLASTLPLSLDPNIMTTPSGASHPGRPFVTESIARFGQQR
ncbi:hypothetical protein MCOR01_005500 [Pyricularia oryzae]|nr:hypothetical protein MCOR01_005500 [Pyricularia oryzae]